MKIFRFTLAILIFLSLCFIGIRIYKPEWITSDKTLMWQTRDLSEKGGKGATPKAVKAAARFFEKTNLVGMTREEVIAAVGHPIKSSDSSYRYPFYLAEKGAIVYRFDTGTYGCQYDVIFDAAGKVKEVKERGIHD